MKRLSYTRLNDCPTSINHEDELLDEQPDQEIDQIDSRSTDGEGNKEEEVEKTPNCCSRVCKFIMDYYFVPFIILMNYIYISSLQKCPYPDDGSNQCIDFLKGNIGKWLLETQICSFLAFTIIISNKSIYIKLFVWANLIVLCLVQDDYSIYDHGGLNRIFLASGLLLCFCGYQIAKCIKSLFLKHIAILVFIIFSILTALILLYTLRIEDSCDNWQHGINGKSLQNFGEYCTVPDPTYCEMDIRGGLFNINNFIPDCDGSTNKFDPSQLTGEVRNRKDAKIFGFPRDEKFADHLKTTRIEYNAYIKEHVFDMEDPNIPDEVKENTEAIIDTTDPHKHKLTVSVKPNITRAVEQQKLREQIISKEKEDGTYDTRVDKNLIILYFDNISRAHFMRKMPKTIEFLESISAEETSDSKAFQFFRYHSAFYNTIYSNNGLYYGQVMEVEDTSQNVFQTFSDNGYITGFFKDACEMTSNSFINPDDPIYSWDHRGGSFTCDTNYEKTSTTSLVIINGKDSIIKRCHYGQVMHMYQLNYLREFWEAYPDNRKVFRTHFSEAHELLGNLISHVDGDVANFLKEFNEKGYLKDTYVKIIADHGAHAITFRIPFLPDDSRYVENYLPVMFDIVPRDVPSQVLENLEANEQAFISSFDVYTTLKTIAGNKVNDNESAKSYSYISQEMPKDHDCSDHSEYVEDCWCMNDKEKLEKQYKSRSLFYLSF